MGECKWTDDQLKAIEVHNIQTIVSAAAGSGKTAVLTERVKNIISDSGSPNAVSELLVVTFTRAAAAEMRDRIAKALQKRIATAEPDEAKALKKQLLLLPTADICTMDSFCSKIVRENFNEAGVSPDFRIIDDGEHKALLKDTAEIILDRAYEEGDAAFELLTSMFIGESNDNGLSDIIIKLYNESQSYPFPEKWLKSLCCDFEPGKKPEQTGWVGIILNYAEMLFDYYSKAFSDMLKRVEADGDFKPDYISWYQQKIKKINSVIDIIHNGSFDDFITALYSFDKLKKAAGKSVPDKPLKTETDELVSAFAYDVNNLLEYYLPSSEQNAEDTKVLYPVVKKLCGLVNDFANELIAVKTARDEFSFNDILHKCIRLLVEFSEDGKPVKSELSKMLSHKYNNILIDEYQDTNEAQNIIFEMISRNKSNLYCVGDVKQSIYRFRLASPELFINLMDQPVSDGDTEVLSKILLKQNFRSRRGITECVNFLFSRLMSRDVGDIDYTEDDYLNFGAKYPEKDLPDVTVSYAELVGTSADDAVRFEAEKIAEYIKSVMNNKNNVTVGNNDETRPVQYGDFCILLRVSKRADIYASELVSHDIPCNYISDGKVGSSKEILFLTSLLKTVSNPLLDVPLAAVMMSPVFGFTADELAELRIDQRKGELYRSLVERSGFDKKAAGFLKKLNVYRNIAAAYTVYDFVKYIIDDTGLFDIYLSYGKASSRTAAIKAFLDVAYKFTEDGRTGLNSFIRYTDKLIETEALTFKDIGCGSENSVKIMTIHKSKGLEFPYVILPQCFREFRFPELKSKILISRRTGIGIKIRNDEKFTKYHSLSSVAAYLDSKKSDISEEMRILYVALTRAKENLVLFCTDTVEANIKRIRRFYRSMSFSSENRIHPFCVYSAKNTAEWIFTCFAAHPDCSDFANLLGIIPEYDQQKFNIDFKRHDLSCSVNASEEDEPDEPTPAQVDKNILDHLKKISEFVYPYDALNGVLAKRTASSLESGKELYRHTYSKPAFAKEKLTGAQKGTAVHKFLEICDFGNAAANSEAEAARLLTEGRLTDEEYAVIDHEAVKAFFNCPVGQSVLSADKVEKEYEFSVLRPARELYPELPEKLRSEEIVVDGKIDCAFIKDGIAYIIDYKTDNITDEAQLVGTYSAQVKMYCTAFAECELVPVDKCYIYSFKLKKFIEL